MTIKMIYSSTGGILRWQKKEAAKTVETKTVNTGFIDNVEALEAKMKEMREAQKIFATFTQGAG